MGTGLAAAAFVVWPLPGANKLYDLGRFRVDPLLGQTIEWFRTEGYRSEDVIYAQSNVAQQLSVFGGLSVVGQDSDLFYVGIDMKILGLQQREVRKLRSRLDPSALEALGVRWLVFSDEELRNLGVVARDRLERGEGFAVRAEFPAPRPGARRRVWRVDTLAKP